MSKKSIFSSEPSGSFRAKIMARLFDLLLVGGYIACGFLTYFLLVDHGLAKPAAASSQSSLAQALNLPPQAAAPELPAVATTTTPTPTPATTPQKPPEEQPATNAEQPGGQDLATAMNGYVEAITKGEFSKARAMRADANVPPLEKLKQVKSMKVVSLLSYPRINRDKGSVYVSLKIEKEGKAVHWKGRVDWEKREKGWVTTDWDSSAEAPDKSE